MSNLDKLFGDAKKDYGEYGEEVIVVSHELFDAARKEYEDAKQSVWADDAWVCERCGHNASSEYCSNCNLPFPPRRQR